LAFLLLLLVLKYVFILLLKVFEKPEFIVLENLGFMILLLDFLFFYRKGVFLL